ERLNIYLPGGSPAEARYWKQATDYLKVIATTAPCDLTSFEQGGLNVSPIRAIEQMTPGSALEQLLRSAISEKSLRFQRIVNHSGIDWGTSELAFTIVRKSCD
ncbi:MAG: hypothetical protein KDE31_38275, partial [Caldilineaceae bacterium]|nr:hypothetical protein [Caldilineaceae bacterium]